jgi:ABC-2 type transport system ATP-binding protein
MILRLERATKCYGPLKALDGVTVGVRPGIVGLLGPNGAGKSTLIKVLLGLVRMNAGEAWVLDRDVRREARTIRGIVGYMPEDDCYVSGLRGIEAVAYAGELGGLPRDVALRRSHEILDYVLIGEERYREVQTYSTGMRQKVRLAQALVHAPRILFLDEPTSGLDPEGREWMLHRIRDLAEKREMSVLLSTHILKDVEVSCDSVLLLGRGKLLVHDSLENLQRSVDPAHHVRFSGDGERLRRRLEADGWTVEARGEEELTLRGREEGATPAIFRAAREVEAAIRGISRSRTSLEEIFLRAVRTDDGNGKSVGEGGES